MRKFRKTIAKINKKLKISGKYCEFYEFIKIIWKRNQIKKLESKKDVSLNESKVIHNTSKNDLLKTPTHSKSQSKVFIFNLLIFLKKCFFKIKKKIINPKREEESKKSALKPNNSKKSNRYEGFLWIILHLNYK